MNLRHAAALALVGWYLMFPPVDNHNHVELSAPMVKWQSLMTFDSAGNCENARSGVVNRPLSSDEMETFTEDSLASGHVPLSDAEVRTRISAMLCISSNDPRLKRN